MDLELIKRINSRLSTVGLALPQVAFWQAFLLLSRRHHVPAWLIPVDALGIVFGILTLLVLAYVGARLRVLVGLLLLDLSIVIGNFSLWYWVNGTEANFSHPLTHLDAVYVAFGTLSTAGTGNLLAVSETARRLQTLQMGIDVLLVVFVFGVVASRFGARRP